VVQHDVPLPSKERFVMDVVGWPEATPKLGTGRRGQVVRDLEVGRRMQVDPTWTVPSCLLRGWPWGIHMDQCWGDEAWLRDSGRGGADRGEGQTARRRGTRDA